jgi:hypothetical protein
MIILLGAADLGPALSGRSRRRSRRIDRLTAGLVQARASCSGASAASSRVAEFRAVADKLANFAGDGTDLHRYDPDPRSDCQAHSAILCLCLPARSTNSAPVLPCLAEVAQ